MIATGAQSPFYGAFVEQVEPDLAAAREAIAARDLDGLRRVAERSCLRMHAAMMAGDPALIYLTPESWQVINLARKLREEGLPLLFTADAGPNVKLFCAPRDEASVAAAVEAQGCARRVIRARPGPGAEVVTS
jgi:diphosphomevalonate decarboxylase